MLEQTYNVALLDQLTMTADVVDAKTIEGNVSLSEFLAAFVSYMPAWVRVLYRIREGMVKLMGIQEDDSVSSAAVTADTVPMTKGQNLAFFTVVEAMPDEYWVGAIDESHLSAYLAIEREAIGSDKYRFHVTTLVYYKQWIGRLYFNIIRPFHHLIVNLSMRAAVRAAGGQS